MEEPSNNQKPTIRQKWTDFWAKIKDLGGQTFEWCKAHKEILMAFGPAVIGGGVEIAKAVIKAKDHKEERELEEEKLRSAYDDFDGVHLETEHLLNKEEYHRFKELKEQGKTTGEALYELDLLSI